MTVPKRFTLSTLLLLMLVVASVFGYLQWRRQWLKAEIAVLNQLGDTTSYAPTGTGFTVRKFDKLILNGKFWPSVEPEIALMPIGKLADGRYYIEGKLLTPIEAKAYLEQLRSRLHAVGVHLSVMFMEPKGDGHRPTLVENFESL